VWSAILLYDDNFGPHWLPWTLASICGLAAVVVLIGPKRWAVASLAAGAAATMVGSLAISVAIAASLSQGPIPTAFGRGTGGPSFRTVGALLADTHTRWSAAINGALPAAALELQSRTSVMAIGGWSSDPVPTLDQFIDDVRAGRIAYYVAAARGGVAPPPGAASRSDGQRRSNVLEIADWVAEHYSPVKAGRSLVYYRLN
jgi:hypothetical protein